MFGRFRDYVGDENPHRRRLRYGDDLVSTGLWSQVCGVVAAALAADSLYAFWVSVAMAALGTILLIAGTRRHAHAKGYRPWVGWLGLLSLVGVVLLRLLPDQNGRDGQRRGFMVLTPKQVSTTWVQPLDDPRYAPRPWGEADQMAELWQHARSRRDRRTR